MLNDIKSMDIMDTETIDIVTGTVIIMDMDTIITELMKSISRCFTKKNLANT